MQIYDTYKEPYGHTTMVLGTEPDQQSLKRDVVDVLKQVWMGDIVYDEDIDSYADALREFGVDLEKELRTRGMDDPFSDKKDRLVKDRGDVGEVLGYLRETRVRGVQPNDMFAPLIWAKLKGGVTTHGIDGIGFIWGAGTVPDRMILCEWKHTTQSGSVRDPCSSASDAWAGLTPRRLLQELRRVRRIYEDRSEFERAQKVKWFAYRLLKEDPSVLCVTMVVHPDTISIGRARQEIESHLVKKCAEHPDNPISPVMHEGNLLPLSDMIAFLDSCYEEFVDGDKC